MSSGSEHVSYHSSPQGGRKRIEWIDLGKALGILLVSFGHLRNGDGSSVWLPALDTTINGIYLFHMPLFFLLGGLTFSKRGGFRSFIHRKVRTLLVPYYVFSLYFLAKPLAMLIVPSLGTTFQTEHNYGIVHQFYDVLIMGNGLWFLMAFFIAEIIMYGLTEIAQSRVAQLSIGSILIIASFSLGILKLVTWVPFQIVKGIQIAGFMLIGLALRNLLLHMKRTVAIIIVVFAIAIVTTSQALITFGIINKSSTVSIYIAVVIIAAIAGAFGFTCMAIVIKHNSWLSYIGRNSLVYYALNAVTLNVVKFGLFRALHIDATALSFVPQFCIGVIATALAVLLLTIENIFVQRWMWWSIGKQRE